ncbi:MAG: undecaprenyldiphospho-muramoylpentapeptide beta-N-acetylglucosaminyltransferase, partial [Chitinophagales bacterium]|nr:undecaprenyldiphospho-muramoylpentapeptide beta-N-acetylglucosaminyltransferase [Chitinophagales bacterium]
PSAAILFVGAHGRMEMQKVPEAGFEIKGLNIAGFQRGALVPNLLLPFKVVRSLLQAYRVIKQFRPDVTVGVGGYASGPVLLVSSLLGVPAIIQEQNSYAGITNKILGRFVRKVCVAYDNMEKYFPSQKIVVTGNPVRSSIYATNLSKESACRFWGLDSAKPVLLAVGGSLGARTINESIFAEVEKLVSKNIQLIWQTGRNYFPGYSHLGQKYPLLRVIEFIKDMDKAYAAADVIISRAGALSIAELQLAGKPAILVPSPNVAEDHQTHNAMALALRNAAIVVKDSEARDKLVTTAVDLLANNDLQRELSENIKKMAIHNASERIVDVLLKEIQQ